MVRSGTLGGIHSQSLCTLAVVVNLFPGKSNLSMPWIGDFSAELLQPAPGSVCVRYEQGGRVTRTLALTTGAHGGAQFVDAVAGGATALYVICRLKTDDVDDDGGRGHCNDYRSGTCTDATDCSLGGLCVKGKFVCEVMFTGPNCVALNLNLATRGPAWNPPSGKNRNGSLGGNVVLAAGKFYLFTGVDPHGGLPWTQVQPIKTKTDDAVAITAPIRCTDDWDCSLAGSCGSDGLCLCDSGWQGPTCAMVAFDRAPSVGHAFRPGHGFTTWGGSPIQADNHSMYYLFASVNVHGTLSSWWNTSVIVTATSTSAAGPYQWDRKTVTIGPQIDGHVRPSKHIDTHRWDSVAVQNPVVVRLKKGAGFVLYYAGSNLTTPHYGMNNSAIMGAFATSLDGPWENSEHPVLVPFTSPESWEAGSVCNPAAHVHDDNSVTLAYRGYWDNNGVAFAWAPSWRGPFRRLYGGSGLFAERPTLEDPFVFSSPRGFHVLMHYFKADNCSNTAGGRQCALVGNHAFSRAAPRPSADGASGANGADTEFFLAPNRGAAAGGYDLGVEFANGTAARFSHREEPKMLLEWSEATGDYVPTHLFNVVVEQQKAPADGWAHLESYVFAQPLKTIKTDDLAWVEQPQGWHQQAVRIVDHPFSTLAELREFGLRAKKAGVSVVQLVGPQKTKRCIGVWCGGLGLCDHINGSFPADDSTATLAEWQQMLKDIRPVRLMWWANFAYWSSQGEVAEQAMADPTSDVGRFFSYGPNASVFPVCPGKWLGNSSDPAAGSWGYSNPCFKDRKSGEQLCAQGSWGSVAGDCNRSGVSNTSACFNDKLDGCSKATMDRFGRCIPSFNANLAHKEYVDYLADALANSWSRNLGIDGYIVDTSLQVPCSPGINPKFGEPGGSEFIFYNTIIGRVREKQPQVVLSGEDCAGWSDAIEHNFQLPGTKAAGHVQAMQAAVEKKDLDTIESVVASSGADAAAVICYLHPGLDGRPSGACPTLYYRDTFESYSVHNVSVYRLWVALEAASGILTEHQHSPTAVFGQRYGSWNVSADPYIDDGKESPLWAFARSRALNRLALRTKLHVSSAVERSRLTNFTLYADANCYKGHGGVVLPGHTTQPSAAACAALCTADEKCDCVMYQARKGNVGQSKGWKSCWKRAECEPLKFERDNLTQVYDTYVKWTVAPSRSGGAIAYLKHDALGPRGDAAVVILNPGAAQTLAVDLSSLPPSMLGGIVVPVDLFTNATAASPLSKSWSVKMAAGSFVAFGFHGLGVFAPRKGKSGPCKSLYSKPTAATTMQACFLDCANAPKCKNVFVEMKALPKWLEKPGPISCTLLGAVAEPNSACTSGNGTLIAALPGARPMAVKTDDSAWEASSSSEGVSWSAPLNVTASAGAVQAEHGQLVRAWAAQRCPDRRLRRATAGWRARALRRATSRLHGGCAVRERTAGASLCGGVAGGGSGGAAAASFAPSSEWQLASSAAPPGASIGAGRVGGHKVHERLHFPGRQSAEIGTPAGGQQRPGSTSARSKSTSAK